MLEVTLETLMCIIVGQLIESCLLNVLFVKRELERFVIWIKKAKVIGLLLWIHTVASNEYAHIP